MLDANTSTLPTLKIYPSDHPFIKDDIVEVSLYLTPRGTPIGIVVQFCEHHNVSYISQSINNNPWNHNSYLKTGIIFGSSAWAEKNQQHSNKF